MSDAVMIPELIPVPLGTVNLYVGDEEGDRATAEAFYFGLLGLVPDPRLPGQFRSLSAAAAADDSAADDVVAGSNAGISDAFSIGTDDLIHANAGRLAQMHLPVSGRRGQVGSQYMKHGEITLAYDAAGLATVRESLSGDLGDLAARRLRHQPQIQQQPLPKAPSRKKNRR